jgi:hypothetical protein
MPRDLGRSRQPEHQAHGARASDPRRVHRHSVGGLRLILGVSLLALAGCVGTSMSRPQDSGTPGSHVTTGSHTTTIRIQVIKGQDNSTLALVPVYIHGQGPYSFILDTGASISLIEQSLTEQYHLPVVSGSQQQVSGVGGSKQVVLVTITNWRVGSVSLPKAMVASASVPGVRVGGNVRGLLGSDIWSTFGKFTLDYAAGTLTVYNTSARAPAALREASGAVAHSGALTVAWRRST